LCSGVDDGKVVEVLKTNFETTLERGPGLVQARDYFNHGGERLVFAGIDQNGATPGTTGTVTLSEGSGLASATSDDTEQPLFSRELALRVKRVLGGRGRPGSTYAQFSVDGGVTYSEAEILLAVTGGDGTTTPYKTRLYYEHLAAGGLPYVGTDGKGPYVEFTEDSGTPDDSFLVGDVWTWDSSAVEPTQEAVLDAAEALVDWRDAFGMQTAERQGGLIGIAHPLEATFWDDLNSIAQERYESQTAQNFNAFIAVAPQANEATTQEAVDRVTSDVAAYRAALGTDKPWAHLTWLWGRIDDGFGNTTPRPLIGAILGRLAADGAHVERSYAWRKAARALRMGIALDPPDLTLDQLEQLAGNRVSALVHEPGLGFYPYCDYHAAQADSKLTNFRYLRSVNFAATVALLRSQTWKFAPGTDGRSKADQENYINDELRRLVELGAFDECTFHLGDVVDPEAERLVFKGTITVRPVKSRESYDYDLYLVLS